MPTDRPITPPMLSASLVAALVGYGGTVALVLAAATAVGATPAQTTSWLVCVCTMKALGSAFLSWRTRVPTVLAWSTPGAALIAASSGFTLPEAVAAFVLTGLLIVATGLVPALERAVRAIPPALGAAMLAGVLLPLVVKAPAAVSTRPALVLPMIVVFLLVRVWNPVWAVLAALAVGIVVALLLGVPSLPSEAWSLPSVVFVRPHVSGSALLSLGLPLYLVTMASQNLPGFTVQQGLGYEPPVREALTVSGGLSVVGAFGGAHPINMAAITAAICMSPDVHPDRDQRWRVGVTYGGWWLLIGLAGPFVIAALGIMPGELIATIAGLALMTPLMGALASAFEQPASRFAAAATLATGASGLTLFHIGAAFWSLAIGLLVFALDRAPRLDAGGTESGARA